MGEPQELPDVAPSVIEGWVDAVEDRRVFGWAWDRSNPTDRLQVEALLGETRLAEGLADRPRRDLGTNGIGDGAHAFELELPEDAAGDGDLVVNVSSPTTSARVTLKRRPSGPDAEAAAQLNRVLSMIEGLAVAQRQIANATHGVLRDIRDGLRAHDPTLEKVAAEVTAGRQALQKQMTNAEVFLLRFDTLLREFEEKQAAPRLESWMDARICAVAALAAGLIAGVVVALFR